MKTAKIVAISSVLALLLVACNNNDKPKEDGKNNGGFEYVEPDQTVPDAEDKTKWDYTLDKTVEPLVASAKNDDEKSMVELIKVMDKNDLYPNKIEGSIVDEDNYDHDQDPATEFDSENYKKELTFAITRTDAEFKKDGTSTLKETTYNPDPVVVSKNYTYSLAKDEKEERINEYYYEGTTAPSEPTRSVSNSKANLKKEMKLINITTYKDEILESIKKDNNKYINWDDVKIGIVDVDGKEGHKNLRVVCTDEFESNGLSYTNYEIYEVIFAKEGWVTNLNHAEVSLVTFSAASIKTLKSFTKSYTFSKVSIESEK